MAMAKAPGGRRAQHSPRELIEIARKMRALDVISIHAAGSGHPGGTLSVMDLVAALYLHEARLDPGNPRWPDRDRIFFSAGHKAPALYCALAAAGYCSDADVVTLRKLGSPFQGHPHAPALPGVEVSSGSLGQGLGIAVGCALNARLEERDYRVYCLLGDGEHQEGSVWEAAMAAGHYHLDNLCAIVDRNRLQIDGWVSDVMEIDSLGDKYRAFGWEVVEIDGHDMDQILGAFAQARHTAGRPTAIIAQTIKGKGVSFMENEAGWHGVSTRDEAELQRALSDIACPEMTGERVRSLLAGAREHQSKVERELQHELQGTLPGAEGEYWWNAAGDMRVDMDPTRMGFGRCLKAVGDDSRIVTIHADISNSIRITDFEKDNPERRQRVFSVGIAEQNMMSVAAGLALEGRIPVTGTYGVFAAGRPWDQIRTTICYDNLNVKIAGAHGGISVGADGATHQALEEIALMSILPNMHLFVPCDSLETERLARIAILDVVGPAYLRFAREATPVVTADSTPLVMGKANVARFRRRNDRFVDAFEWFLAGEYRSEDEDLTLVACGPMVAEAMRAAWILKERWGIESRVLNLHTVKPLDRDAIQRAGSETGVLLACEEHQKGGFGALVAAAWSETKPYAAPSLFGMVGVEDRFGESGGPWELMIRFGLTAEHVAAKARLLLQGKSGSRS